MARNTGSTAAAETPTEAPAAAALQEGEHNPFLEGVLQKGKEANDAIESWMKQRGTIRDSARQAVAIGFASPEQVERVEKLFPMPKRGKKDETPAEETPAEDTPAAA